MPSIPSVPLIRARPSLARSTSGSRPAAASAVAPSTSEPSARRAAPSPSSTSAADASGARSPLAPSEPCSRTTGVTPAASRASIVSATTGRAPEKPIARLRARRNTIARTTSRSTSGPIPAACERISAICSSAERVGRDHRVGQRAEPGRHAVHRLGLIDEPVDDGGAPLERGAGVGAQLDAAVVAGDGDDLGGGDAVRIPA